MAKNLAAAEKEVVAEKLVNLKTHRLFWGDANRSPRNGYLKVLRDGKQVVHGEMHLYKIRNDVGVEPVALKKKTAKKGKKKSK